MVATEAATKPVIGGRWGLSPYSPEVAGRDLRIDLLRGFCVVAMVVDHIAGPSFLYGLTGGNRFFTSAAEAFIFISGLVMGLVYRRLIERDGLGSALRRAIERAMTLYLLTITLTLGFIPASEILNLPWAQGVDFRDPAAFVVSVLTLHRTYYLVDIPMLYSILILISPLALVMLSQGRVVVVLGGSWLLWGAYQFFPDQAAIPWEISGNYLFFLSAWQVFFFTGLVLGWHHGQLARALAGFPRRTALLVAAFLFAGSIALYRVIDQLARFWPNEPERVADIQAFILEVLLAKSDVRPGRIIASLIVFAFFYLLVTELWQPIRRLAAWLLIPLGESALYAYAAHVVLAIPVALALDQIGDLGLYRRPLNAAIQIATILLIWVLVRRRLFFVNASEGRARFAWPVAATILSVVLLPLDPSPTMPGLARAQEQDPSAARVARAFGTPVPGTPPRGEGTPVALPTPRPNLRSILAASIPRGAPPVSEYVGPIKGRLENLQFFSTSLNRDMPYFIYLPPGYDSENRRYPVLYMLHGNSGSYEEWLAYGFVDRADRMIAAREILPLVIVLPQGDFSYWVNLENGNYSDYLARDLVRHISATYRALPGRGNRAVGGLSMGGTGALVNAFQHPNVFGVVAAHSPALPAEGERDFLGAGSEYAMRDPISLARSAPRADLANLRIWLDVGDEDAWLSRTETLARVLERRGASDEWHVFPGEHWGGYWTEHILDYLRFYDAALNPERGT